MNLKKAKALRKEAKARYGGNWRTAYKWVKNEAAKRKKQG